MEPSALAVRSVSPVGAAALPEVVPAGQIADATVRADPAGQWAAKAVAGSQYGWAERSAARAVGAPDVPGPGVDDHPNAWCPATRDRGVDWIELTFARPVRASEVRVRQNNGPGAITKVEAIDATGLSHVWWEGVDPFGQAGDAREAIWFAVRVQPTLYAVAKIKLTLNLAAHPRWKQIDAVQLVEATPGGVNQRAVASEPRPTAPAGNTVSDAPHRFAVSGSFQSPFNFSASQPGPIRVQVQAQGAPVTVTLYHPDGRKIDHQGSGSFSFADEVTAADLAQGHLWGVSVRATVRTATVAPIATGTITVTHPPGDPVAVRKQLETYASRTTVLRQAPAVLIDPATPETLRQIVSAPVREAAAGALVLRAVEGTPMIRPAATAALPTTTVAAPIAVGLLPGVIATTQFAGPEPILRFDTTRGSVGATVKVWGKDLFPPKTPAGNVMKAPESFGAELHVAWGDRKWVVPMKAWENFRGYDNIAPNETEDDETRFQQYINGRWYTGTLSMVYERGYTLVLPDIPSLDDVILSVTMKTSDGRSSKPYQFTYVPVRTTATLGLPFVNGRLLDSKLSDVYPNADISRKSIRRDSLFLGFEGEDTFYHTAKLKNGWKVTGIDLVIYGQHFGGAEITASGVGTESLFAKVRWYIITAFPSFELDFVDYTLVYRLAGPVGQPFL